MLTSKFSIQLNALPEKDILAGGVNGLVNVVLSKYFKSVDSRGYLCWIAKIVWIRVVVLRFSQISLHLPKYFIILKTNTACTL